MNTIDAYCNQISLNEYLNTKLDKPIKIWDDVIDMFMEYTDEEELEGGMLPYYWFNYDNARAEYDILDSADTESYVNMLKNDSDLKDYIEENGLKDYTENTDVISALEDNNGKDIVKNCMRTAYINVIMKAKKCSKEKAEKYLDKELKSAEDF